ncbi:MAG: sodium:solute symporter [Clostridia bacterium]|nr:sodium:solute symporter [Clostridia bacterium]
MATWQLSSPILGLVVTVIMFAIFYYIGWTSSRKTANVADLYAAGYTIGPVVNGLGMGATWASLATFLGVSALILQLQVPFVYLWIQWGISIPLLTLLYGTSLRRMQAYTPATFIRARFGKEATVIAASWMVLIMIMYALGQMIGIAQVFEMLFGLSYNMGLIIGGLATIGFITLGGMLGASYNAAFQMVVMILTMVVPMAAIMKAMGSSGWWFPPLAYGDMVPAMKEVLPTFFDMQHPFKWYFALIPAFTLGPIGLPHLAMRVFTASSLKSARAAVVWFAIFLGLLFCGTYTVGFAGNYYVATTGTQITEPDKIVLILNVIYNPAWVAALVMGGALAAGLSTVSGNLLAIGALVSQDILGVFAPNLNEKSRMRIGYVALGVGGLVALVLAFNPPKFLVTSILWAFGLCASTITPTMLLGVWWKQANRLAGIVSSIIAGITYIVISPHVMPHIVVGSGVTASLGMAGGMVTVPLAFFLFIVLSWIFNSIPGLERFKPTEEDKKLVDRIHGWGDYQEYRYNGNTGVALAALASLCVFIWGLMPW